MGISVGFVEDSDEDYALFARVFAPRWNLRRWATGEEAIRAFVDLDPRITELQAILVDLDLPGIDGLSVIEQVRGLPGGDIGFVCMVSGTSRPDAAGRALRAGADAFIPKPRDVAGLRALADRVAELASRRSSA